MVKRRLRLYRVEPEPGMHPSPRGFLPAALASGLCWLLLLGAYWLWCR